MGVPANNTDNAATSDTTRFVGPDPLVLALCAGPPTWDNLMLEELAASLGIRPTRPPMTGCLPTQAGAPQEVEAPVVDTHSPAPDAQPLSSLVQGPPQLTPPPVEHTGVTDDATSTPCEAT
jgi:hypothetical protein